MKIELFLNDIQVELDKDIDFVLNKQFTELTDLTSIIVDYTKTIKIPMTAHNNELFNYVYRFEHQVLVNDDIITYDPSQKIPMTLMFNGSLVMEGYALLNSVNIKEKTYEINLYGQLGRIFSDLKEKPLRSYTKPSSDSRNGWWMPVKVNCSAVVKSINNEVHDLDWDSTDFSDFWGFAPPLYGKTDLIDTKSYEVYGASDADRVKKFVDVMEATRGWGYCDYFIKDGLDFNQYKEWRSYLGRPYVYVDKIIQLVQNEINSSGYGYTMNLDPDWFNSDNPYWSNLCFFPGRESIIGDGEEGYNGIVNFDNNELVMPFPAYLDLDTSLVDLEGYTYSRTDHTYTVSNTDPNSETTATLTLNCDGIVLRDRVVGVESLDDWNSKGKWAFYNLSVGSYPVPGGSYSVVPIRYIGIYDTSDKLLFKLYLCDNNIHSIHKSGSYYSHFEATNVWNILRKQGAKVVVPNSCSWVNGSVSGQYCEVSQTYNFGSIVIPTNSFKLKVECEYVNLQYGNVVSTGIDWQSYHFMVPFKNNKYKNVVSNDNAVWADYITLPAALNVSSNLYRSGSWWSIQDVLGSDFNPFRWMIDYVKKFRLFFDIDYMTKTITLKSGYFNTVDYKDMTVDYSKDVIVEPIVDKYATVKYGYRKNESPNGNKYYKYQGVEYGDMDIYTTLKINSEELKLTPDEDEGVFIPGSLKNLYWSNLNSTNALKMANPLGTTKIINTLNKDGKTDYYPFFAFRLRNHKVPGPIDPDTHLPFQTLYYLTDDSPFQRNTGEYTYLDPVSWHGVAQPDGTYYCAKAPYLPQFDNYLLKDGLLYWTTFSAPKEVYNGYLPSADGNVDIYSLRWKSYLDELFNTNNKKVTCYVRMTYPEFINFKFNQLFVIDKSVFLVNKIIDFNPNSTEATKVELIQLSNPGALE